MARKSPHEPNMTLPDLFPGATSTRLKGWPVSRPNHEGSTWTLYGVTPSGGRCCVQAMRLETLRRAVESWPVATLEDVREATGWAD